MSHRIRLLILALAMGLSLLGTPAARAEVGDPDVHLVVGVATDPIVLRPGASTINQTVNFAATGYTGHDSLWIITLVGPYGEYDSYQSDSGEVAGSHVFRQYEAYVGGTYTVTGHFEDGTDYEGFQEYPPVTTTFSIVDSDRSSTTTHARLLPNGKVRCAVRVLDIDTHLPISRAQLNIDVRGLDGPRDYRGFGRVERTDRHGRATWIFSPRGIDKMSIDVQTESGNTYYGSESRTIRLRAR